MKDLFARIEASAPEPLTLTRKELASLVAWLETHPATLRLSLLQQARRGDPEAQEALAAEEEWRQHLEYVCRFNQELQQGTGHRQPPSPAATDPDPEGEAKLTPSEELAFLQYTETCRHIRKPNPTDNEVYEAALKLSEEDRLSGGRLMVSRSSWTSYVSRARSAMGQLKNNPRAGRAKGGTGSVVPFDQV